MSALCSAWASGVREVGREGGAQGWGGLGDSTA